MSFLPAICSIVQEDVGQTSAGVGPVAVILCVSSAKVFDVARLCRQFVSEDVLVVEGYGERNIYRIAVSLPRETVRNTLISFTLAATAIEWLRYSGLHGT